MALIEIDRVSKVFGSDPRSVLPRLDTGESKAEILKATGHVVGLRHVSLDIEEAQVFIVMGLSGSGKSTLIRHLNRLIEPTSGEIRLQGRDILKATTEELRSIRQTRMSMVFQRFGLMPHRTVIENVAYGLEARGEPRDSRLTTARDWIGRVGLEGYEDSYPSTLSGGMQQRVGLARGLATNPQVLLMDEPFSALDPLIRHDMQQILVGLQHELKKTIVFITHDLDEALAIGDRIAILHDGRLVQAGPPAEIVLKPATDYVHRFVANVNRGRALKARDIMDEPRSADEPSVGDAQTLEAVLPVAIAARIGVHVTDTSSRPVGFIARDRLASVMAGDRAP